MTDGWIAAARPWLAGCTPVAWHCFWNERNKPTAPTESSENKGWISCFCVLGFVQPMSVCLQNTIRNLNPTVFWWDMCLFLYLEGMKATNKKTGHWTQKKKTAQKRRKYCRFGVHLPGNLRHGPTPVRLVRFHLSPKKLCVGMVVFLFNRGFTLVLTALRGMVFWIEGKQLYTYLWFLVVEEHAEWRFLVVNG